jgi:hypothetical protein
MHRQTKVIRKYSLPMFLILKNGYPLFFSNSRRDKQNVLSFFGGGTGV